MTTYDQIIQKGQEQGQELVKITATQKMIKEGFPTDVICKVLDVSESFVEKYRNLAK